MQLFSDPLLDEFASWALGFSPTGGGDLGEILAIAAAHSDVHDDEFFDAWCGAAHRHYDAATAAETAGHRSSARDHYLRAASYLTVANHPLYGSPVDPRLRHAFDLQAQAFEQAMALGEPPGEPLKIPFECHDMRGYFLRARGTALGERRPLVIATNGYDATLCDMFFATGAYMTDRGYNCLLFDGPGQGAMLVHDGVAMVPDWERVISPVVDFALDRPDVDPDRIVLHGWSLGGFLALRAASGEHRLAACVADPAQAGVFDARMAAAVGLSQQDVDNLPEISDAGLATLDRLVETDRSVRWNLVNRDYWVNGAHDIRSLLRAVAPFTIEGRLDQVTCPVLGTTAQNDPLSAGAEELLARMKTPTTLLRFTAVEGADMHCELLNRPLLNRRVLDWLDDVLAVR
jgi:pimeloyl-ACP methyl ester carboxylesterase